MVFFEDKSDLLSDNKLGGKPASAFLDINGDYRDDLVRLNRVNQLYVDIQSDNGQRFETQEITKIEGDVWAINAGDLDNDGISEIFASGQYNGVQIFKAESHFSDYQLDQVTFTNFFTQNANFVDINNDGYLDVFVCNDDNLNKIFLNDQNGRLFDASGLIDMRTKPSSDNSGNYASVWTDIDNDGDLDFYVSKCRVGIDDATDPRRINMLFINSNGQYIESAAEYGLARGEQTWTSNFGDIDNDGDLDLFMLNHEARSMLFENIDNNFIEIPLLENNELLETEGYQSVLADFNNDGFLDILIGGQEDFLLINNKNKSFIINNVPFGIQDIASFSIGDANNDGFIDVFASYTGIYSSDFDPDKLFVNSQNENNYLALALKGITSNRKGIGAKVMIYGEWGQQMRYIKSGVGYGTSNSLTARFGLDEANTIDSLIIVWPSGVREKYESLEINSHYLATESICIQELLNISSSTLILDCNNPTALVNVNANNQSISWSNGDAGNDITVEKYDHIFAITQESNGCTNISQTIIIDTLATLVKPELTLLDDVITCDKSTIQIKSRNGQDYLWQDGTEDDKFNATISGNYVAKNFNDCDTVASDPIDIEFVDPAFTSQDSTIIITETSIINLEGPNDSVIWYQDSLQTHEIGTGMFFETDSIKNDTVFYYQYQIDQVAPIYIGGESISKSEGEQLFIEENFNPKLFFAVEKTVQLNTISVNALVSGIRAIEIFSITENEVVYVDTLDIDSGISIIDIYTVLQPGEYEMSNDPSLSMQTIGSNSPQFRHTVNQITYPYLIDDFIIIRSSNLGEDNYPNFFDWTVAPILEECISGLFKYEIDYDPISQTNLLESSTFKIYPNPADDYLYINSDIIINDIKVFGIDGRRHFSTTPLESNIKLDLSSLPKGSFILAITTDQGNFNQKVVKM
ncbi:MAG: T9SS type A sorting domain-containing protein [Saprospiraceae bacterium]|nr:T9SS type A sorting domain-containing protein [Saprospiraceae bacterium]